MATSNKSVEPNDLDYPTTTHLETGLVESQFYTFGFGNQYFVTCFNAYQPSLLLPKIYFTQHSHLLGLDLFPNFFLSRSHLFQNFLAVRLYPKNKIFQYFNFGLCKCFFCNFYCYIKSNLSDLEKYIPAYIGLNAVSGYHSATTI